MNDDTRSFMLISKSNDEIVEKEISVRLDNLKINNCEHKRIEVDEALYEVVCVDCGKRIDPMQWLIRLAKEEQYAVFRIENLEKKLDYLEKKISQKSRTKCEHCGKFTRIGGL